MFVKKRLYLMQSAPLLKRNYENRFIRILSPAGYILTDSVIFYFISSANTDDCN